MSMSGIQVDEEIVTLYNNDFKINKKHAYFTCEIDGQQVKLANCTDPFPKDCTPEQCKERYEEMTASLKDAEPMFIIFDFRFKSTDGRAVDKIGLISWISDNCPVKLRMKYGSTKEALPKKLMGVKSIQANDKGDLDFDTIVEELRKSK